MTQHFDLGLRTAVCQVQLDHVASGVTNLDEYQQALVVFRLRDAVLGQAWLPVENGCVTPASLRAAAATTSWTFWLHSVAPEPAPTRPLPSASVVVCTRDRPDDLACCLPGLQALAAQGHEVIIVDNCPSDDRTARLVAGYPMIRYLYEPRPGLDVARNCGLLAAKGEVVAFTDDDVEIDPGWLAALVRNFVDPMVAVVNGIALPLELETPAQRWFEKTNGFARGFVRQEHDASTLNPLAAGELGVGANMAVRRSAINAIGLFDEALDCGTITRSGGDQEYVYRALARGYRVVYEPAALVWHRHRRDWSGLRNTLYSYGVGVFAWWTRCLLVEGELTVLKLAARWFWWHYVKNLIRALLRRPGHMPLDLALAEFRGALAGPNAYLQARRVLRAQLAAAPINQAHRLTLDTLPATVTDQSLEVS
jgi:GT2 family glycosyltransferase